MDSNTMRICSREIQHFVSHIVLTCLQQMHKMSDSQYFFSAHTYPTAFICHLPRSPAWNALPHQFTVNAACHTHIKCLTGALEWATRRVLCCARTQKKTLKLSSLIFNALVYAFKIPFPATKAFHRQTIQYKHAALPSSRFTIICLLFPAKKVRFFRLAFSASHAFTQSAHVCVYVAHNLLCSIT